MGDHGFLYRCVSDSRVGEVMPPVQNLSVRKLDVLADSGINLTLSLVQQGFEAVTNAVVECFRVSVKVVDSNPAVESLEVIGCKISECGMTAAGESH